MARTQKNKATEYHLGLLKAKLARYRAQLLEPTSKGGKPGEGFDVQKSGDARVALIGFPSVGKSTLLSLTTKTASEAASYEFTTLTAIPGVLEYEGVRIQLLDLPGIVEGASQVAKTADLILMMLDATKSTEQRRLLEYELDAVGIRLNKSKPDVVFKQKAAGGITINATVKLTKIDEKAIRTILAGYKIHNCDVMIREDITIDEFIDVLLVRDEPEVGVPALRSPLILIIFQSIDYLLERIWGELGLVKIYTKKRGEHPDLTDPICLRKGATIEVGTYAMASIAHSLKSLNMLLFGEWFTTAHLTVIDKVFGQGKWYQVGLTHQVADEDVVSIFTK
ncbi:Developmentally regulated GTP-binding protein [Rhizoctonia solani]|uniref:Developmentally regulated GTP-binding protein n=1 Tax=Rhizoctonia solani TaxID=456999 RepID=A0A8H7IIV1_9AGAM|nr:Developmentally regulated GTP-binding protein [Rhizoctonia solani]